MPILPTSDEMRRIDTVASTESGIPAAVLMENAGQAAAACISSHNPGASIACLCGTGNNGGDGYVIARHLVRMGHTVRVYSVGDLSHQSELCRFQHEYFSLYSGLAVDAWQPGMDLGKSVIVDAVLGAGMHGEPRSPAREAIEAINAHKTEGDATVYAVDVPSGLITSGEEQTRLAVHATYTITFGYPKYGMHTPRAGELCGKILSADIFFPPVGNFENTAYRYWYTCQDAQRDLPQRPLDTHKGRMGRVVILAGSLRYAGAAVLTAEGALASGCGLVHLAVPQRVIGLLRCLPPEVILHALPDRDEGRFLPDAVATFIDLASGQDAVILGPGLGREQDTLDALKILLPRLDKPCLLDADALVPGLVQAGCIPSGAILTPHVGEFSTLTGTAGLTLTRRETCARDFAETHSLVLVVKDASNIVAAPGERVHWIRSGHPGLARGGSGDILAGLIGGLVSRGMESAPAARLGVWLHGAAAWRVLEAGSENFRSADLIRAIPLVMGAMLSGAPILIPSEPQSLFAKDA